MRIVFLGFASSFTQGMSYQDNYLCKQTLADGHQVTYLSNPEKFVEGRMVETSPEDTVLNDGLHLIRLSYVNCGLRMVTKKVRCFRGVYSILNQEKPNVIFCHNTQYLPVLDVIRYKKAHPEVKIYADTHTDAKNSGTNWLSLHILHRVYYRWLTQKTIPYLEKYFYTTYERKLFSAENYGVPESLMEFYPLGGFIPTEEEYKSARERRRKELCVEPDEVLLVHSGKMDALKRTAELLQAFATVPEFKAKLAIIGSIQESQKETLAKLIEADSRVSYLGWKTADELLEYLCACDLYCEPGSQSATMQNAICCGCAAMLYPHEAYVKGFDYGNIQWVQTREDMVELFRAIARHNVDLDELSQNSWRCARDLLDYRKLAARLYQ